MRNLIAGILIFIGLLTLSLPEGVEPIVSANSSQFLEFSAESIFSQNLNSRSSAHNKFNYLAQSNHGCNHSHGDECHNGPCHFGHCGVILVQYKISPIDQNTEFKYFYQNLNLAVFVSNFFRPPIS
jgi:hypothetical protein